MLDTIPARPRYESPTFDIANLTARSAAVFGRWSRGEDNPFVSAVAATIGALCAAWAGYGPLVDAVEYPLGAPHIEITYDVDGFGIVDITYIGLR